MKCVASLGGRFRESKDKGDGIMSEQINKELVQCFVTQEKSLLVQGKTDEKNGAVRRK